MHQFKTLVYVFYLFILVYLFILFIFMRQKHFLVLDYYNN